MHTIQLMLEKDQRYVDALRSELAKFIDQGEQEQKIARELEAAERRVNTLQGTLATLTASEYSVRLFITSLYHAPTGHTVQPIFLKISM